MEDDIPNSEKDNIYFFDGMDYSEIASKQKDFEMFHQILATEPAVLTGSYKKPPRPKMTDEVRAYLVSS